MHDTRKDLKRIVMQLSEMCSLHTEQTPTQMLFIERMFKNSSCL